MTTSLYHFPWNDLFSSGHFLLTPSYSVMGEAIKPEYFHRFIFRQIKGFVFIDRPKVLRRTVPGGELFILQRRFQQSRTGLSPEETGKLLRDLGYGSGEGDG